MKAVGYRAEIAGQLYISSGEAARRLQVSQRTIIRWTRRKESGQVWPKLLDGLRYWRDPINGYVFFLEEAVDQITILRNMGRLKRLSG